MVAALSLGVHLRLCRQYLRINSTASSITSVVTSSAGRKRIEFSPERLARAKANVEQLDVLGLQDRLEDFCTELTARFGWDLGAPLHANRTAAEDAPAALRARIAADNALDIELWHHAREVWTARR